MKSRYRRTTQSLVILTSNEPNVGGRKSLTVTKVRCHLFLDESNVNDVGPLAQLKIEIQPQVLGGINLFRGKRSGKKGTSAAPPTEYSNTSKHSFLRKDLYHSRVSTVTKAEDDDRRRFIHADSFNSGSQTPVGRVPQFQRRRHSRNLHRLSLHPSSA